MLKLVGSQSSLSLAAKIYPSPINDLLDMSLLDDISLPRFWDRFLMEHVSYTCVGHVFRRQFLTRIRGHIS